MGAAPERSEDRCDFVSDRIADRSRPGVAETKSQNRIATDAKRAASRPDTFDSFAKRWPDAARIRQE
jgi:hypothetical protein